jgi:hypothetical protein
MINGWMTTNLVDRFANKELDFDVYFKPYAFKKMSLWDASTYTAKLIAEKYENLFVSLSGGYDSEFVLKVCIENKIPVTPIIVIMDGGEEETSLALNFCKVNNIEPIVVRPTGKEIIKLWYDYIYIVTLGLYYVLSKKSVSSFNGKKDRYGIESILINI